MKYLIWLIILLAVVVWFQRVKKNIINKHGSATGGPGESAGSARPSSVSGKSPQVEEMVACAHCGLHFPASEAVTDYAGTVFCGEEHRRLHAK